MATVEARIFRESLFAGSDCGQLIASRDWSSTSLGPLDDWPQSLRTACLLLLRSPLPIVMLWGEDGVMIYNDAYSILAGERHPQLLGANVLEGWPEVADFNDNVMRVGLAGGTLSYKDQGFTLYRHGHAEQVWMNLDYSPVLDEDGRPAGVLAIVVETTERVRGERRNAFLFHLQDEVRPLVDPVEIQQAAARLLGQHLRASRVAFAEDTGDGETVEVTGDYTDGVPSIRGTYRYRDYEPESLVEMRSGRIFLRPDVREDPTLHGPEEAAHDAVGLGARLYVPLAKAGRLVAILSVHYSHAHPFSEDEIGLVREVAERIWAAVESARAETALRASEARLSRAHAAAQLGDFTWDLATGSLGLSSQYSRLLGLAPDALPVSAEGFFALIHPDDRGLIEEVVPDLLVGRSERLDAEYRVVRGDGEAVWLAVSAQTEGRLSDGKPARIVGVNYDVTARRQAEEALRQSEAQFRLMADAAPQIIWITNAEGQLEFFNRQWIEYIGAPELPTTAADVAAAAVHPDDAAVTVAAYAEARRTGGVFLVEHRIRSQAGDYRWFLVRAEPYRDPVSGEIVRWYGASVDIHDRKLAEARLRELNTSLEARVVERSGKLVESERRARAILDTSYQLMGLAELDGTIVVANQAALETVGAKLEDVVGRKMWDTPWWSRTPAEGRRVRRELASVARGGSVRYESDIVMPDGSVRSFDFSMRPVLDAQGRPVQLVAEARDITASKAAQAALLEAESARREADALYRAYFENSPEALFVIGVNNDGQFIIEQINPAHEASIGFRLEDVRGKRLEDVLPPGMVGRLLDTYRRVIETGTLYQYQEVFNFRGEPQHWESSLVPVRDASGRITRLIGSSRNVTRQVMSEEALRQSQKMEAVGQLTGGLAHDFNNLIAAVMAALELIRRKSDDIQKVKEFAEAGMQAAERGAKLTGQLLAFSRAQRIELKPVIVRDLVKGMEGLLGSTLGPMVRLHLTLEAEGAVFSDATQLELAILNLAINARDAMRDGGDFTIGTRLYRAIGNHELGDGDYIQISVTDTGTGMPAEVAARAFEPFFTTKEVGKGTGLGLSQVYGIARQAGGGVRIETEPGSGTTVHLYLPRTAHPAQADEEAAPAEARNSRTAATILVVDDDPDVRRMFVASLHALGYQVVEARDGPTALEALWQSEPDLMLIDFAMPGMNGAEVAREAWVTRPDLPIVFASGYADTAAIDEVAGKSARVLRKPFRINDLQSLLVEVLDRHQGTAGLARPGQDRR